MIKSVLFAEHSLTVYIPEETGYVILWCRMIPGVGECKERKSCFEQSKGSDALTLPL